jgi:riboflavin kinase / FMN adenylyltransferase
MEVFYAPGNVPAAFAQAAAALGNFDGFHTGHQHVVGRAAAIAERLNTSLGVVTFDPHPARHFTPDAAPFALTTLEQKLALIAGFGAEFAVVLPFTQDFSRMTADAFLRDILQGQLALAGIVSGFDFTFGKARSGDTACLQRFGAAQDIVVDTVPPVLATDGITPVSSTSVRQKLVGGQPHAAASLLGHWWRLAGEVMHGDKRGRTIGFPTANIGLGGYVRPLFGVYAVRIHGAGSAVLEGVANLGNRPTVDGTEARLEVHVFDFDSDLYGKTLEIEFVEFIRAEMKFSGLDALKAQIAVDSATAQKILRQPAYAANHFKPLTRMHFESVMAK